MLSCIRAVLRRLAVGVLRGMAEAESLVEWPEAAASPYL